MRQILTGFLATTMVVSMAATMTMAAERGASIKLNIGAAPKTTGNNVTVTINALDLELEDDSSREIAAIRIPVRASVTSDGNKKIDSKDILKAFQGKKANVRIQNAYYSCYDSK